MPETTNDDIATGINLLEQALTALEQDGSDDNRITVHAEARAITGIFIDESTYAKDVDARHAQVRELLSRASQELAKNPDELSAQANGYAEEITTFSKAKIDELLSRTA